ncbi:methyltransferase domain-containing protein [Tissierella sp. MSJ-40]|uniref:Methyltransferase domain-containing protein n=1 Tax=Tissierella simiarum TaxID=2841534 RepID=A0ABS6E2W5_9FIRM|nr:methyltransferase domain-containing protein [Tissierella simiarum]MBU5437252.1 methyltransferase domain-containing protein [Tissierella simiarum]
MNKSTIEMLINPYNQESIYYKTVDGQEVLTDQSGNIIPFWNGMPDFLSLEKTDGLNKKYKEFYDKISRFNDAAERVYSLFVNLDELRREWMKDLEIKSGDKVLETSVGTGWNIKVLPKDANYYGLDISKGMLNKCIINHKKWNRSIELFIGNAEYLPFKDETFDSVFHVGGINFFNDRKRAIEEMIRVAKKGTKIIIIDETEKKVAKQYEKTPFVGKYFSRSEMEQSRLVVPVDLVPEEMKEVYVKLLDNGKMYQISFRKP